MRKSALWFGALLLALPTASRGDGYLPYACQVSQPSYKIVPEVVYQDVVRKVCYQVPDPKKKWVYSTKEVNYCGPPCHCPWHQDHYVSGCECCEYCRQCGAGRTMCVQVKKQVDDYSTPKCVVACVVEKVPCVVLRKVPCGGRVWPLAQAVPVLPAVLAPPPPTRATLLAPVDISFQEE